MFPTLLKYMESIKGGMRNLALDIANKKLEEKDDADPTDEAEKVIERCHLKKSLT